MAALIGSASWVVEAAAASMPTPLAQRPPPAPRYRPRPSGCVGGGGWPDRPPPVTRLPVRQRSRGSCEEVSCESCRHPAHLGGCGSRQPVLGVCVDNRLITVRWSLVDLLLVPLRRSDRRNARGPVLRQPFGPPRGPQGCQIGRRWRGDGFRACLQAVRHPTTEEEPELP